MYNSLLYIVTCVLYICNIRISQWVNKRRCVIEVSFKVMGFLLKYYTGVMCQSSCSISI